MDKKLTREELDARLQDLAARADIIAKSGPEGEQVEEVAGEAEVIEQYVAPEDRAYFHDRVEEIIRDAGMVQEHLADE